MDVRFLTEICEAYLVDNDIYSLKDKKQINIIRDNITNNVLSMVKELRESDLELYTMIYDQGKIKQQQIIKQYLDLTYGDEQTINESVLLIAGAGIGILATALYAGKHLSKTVMSIVHSIGSAFESIGKSIMLQGREAKFRYAIIQKNAQDCYKKCGIDPDDIVPTSYFAVRKDPVFFATPKGVKQGTCLRECYVEFAIKSMGLLMQAYFACLKKTGSFSDVENATGDDLIKVISGLKLGTACNEYYKEIKNGFDNFYSLLDFVYMDDDSKKQDANSRLKSELIQKRSEFSRFKSSSTTQKTFTTQKQPFNPKQR